MTRVLLTAFEPYGRWQENASWLALKELVADMPPVPEVTTRLLPVDFDAVRQRLRAELEQRYGYVVHLGQAPGRTSVSLESVALNVALPADGADGPHRRLVEDGPLAYQTELPLAAWAADIRAAGIPCAVSYHAGTFLCNAAFYFTHHFCREMNLSAAALFVHLPLDARQVASTGEQTPSLPTAESARAVRILLGRLAALQGESVGPAGQG